MSFEQRPGTSFNINTICDSCEEQKFCAPFDDKDNREDPIYLCEACLLGMTIIGFEPID